MDTVTDRSRRWLPEIALAAAVLALASLAPGPARGDDGAADRAIAAYQRGLQRRPTDPWTHYRLGDAYVQKFRATADPTWLALAERALRRSLALEPEQASARRHLAYVLYSRHEFEDAAREAARAVAVDRKTAMRGASSATPTSRSGGTPRRRPRTAGCSRRETTLYAHARNAALSACAGDVAGAIRALERALARGRADGRPAEALTWVEVGQLGQEHWGRGDLDAAEAAYRASLTTVPGYHRALAGLAQVLGARGRGPEAVPLLEQAITVVPQLDYVVRPRRPPRRLRPDGRRRAPVRAGGAHRPAERAGTGSSTTASLSRLVLRGSRPTARRSAPARATGAGGAAASHAHDLLAWALYKTGQPEAARAAMTEALRLGTRDAQMPARGMIERALGNVETAAAHLRQALTRNPRFHPRHADEARRALEALDGAATSRTKAEGSDAS